MTGSKSKPTFGQSGPGCTTSCKEYIIRRRIFLCSLQAFIVINGTAARHVEHAAQEWINRRREYVTGLAGGGTLFFVILFLGLGICRINSDT
jgi:hypothetical protein